MGSRKRGNEGLARRILERGASVHFDVVQKRLQCFSFNPLTPPKRGETAARKTPKYCTESPVSRRSRIFSANLPPFPRSLPKNDIIRRSNAIYWTFRSAKPPRFPGVLPICGRPLGVCFGSKPRGKAEFCRKKRGFVAMGFLGKLTASFCEAGVIVRGEGDFFRGFGDFFRHVLVKTSIYKQEVCCDGSFCFCCMR